MIFLFLPASFHGSWPAFSAIILNKQECFLSSERCWGKIRCIRFQYKMTEINILHHFVETRVLNVSTLLFQDKIPDRLLFCAWSAFPVKQWKIPRSFFGAPAIIHISFQRSRGSGSQPAMNIDLREVSVDEKLPSALLQMFYPNTDLSPFLLSRQIFFSPTSFLQFSSPPSSFLSRNRDASPSWQNNFGELFFQSKHSINWAWINIGQIKCPTSSCIASRIRVSRSESNSSAYRWMWVSVNDIIWNSRKDRKDFPCFFFTNFAVFVANNSHCLNSLSYAFRQLVTLSHHTGHSLPQNRCRERRYIFLPSVHSHRCWLIIHTLINCIFWKTISLILFINCVRKNTIR